MEVYKFSNVPINNVTHMLLYMLLLNASQIHEEINQHAQNANCERGEGPILTPS